MPHPPLFPSLLAVGSIPQPSLQGYRTVCLIIGLLSIWMIYVLGNRLMNPFVGLLASLLLAFNPVFLKFSSKILIDGSFTLSLMLLTHALLAQSCSNSKRGDIVVGVLGSLSILLKLTGVLVIPYILFFYLFGLKGCKINNFKRLLIPFGLIFCFLISFLLIYYIQQDRHFFSNSALMDKTMGAPPLFYITNLSRLLVFSPLMIFCIVGIFYLLKQSRMAAKLLMSWIAIFLIGLSLLAVKNYRYSLVYLPPLLLLEAIGIYSFVQLLFKSVKMQAITQYIIIGIVGAFAILNYSSLQSMFIEENKFFKGYPVIGEYIRQNVEKDTIVATNSPALIRYFSGINYQELGGQIVKISNDQNEIKSFLSHNPGHVFWL